MKDKLLIRYVPSTKKFSKTEVNITTYKSYSAILKEKTKRLELSNRLMNISKLTDISLKDLKSPLNDDIRKNRHLSSYASLAARILRESHAPNPLKQTGKGKDKVISLASHSYIPNKSSKFTTLFGQIKNKVNSSNNKKPNIEILNTTATLRMRERTKLMGKKFKLAALKYRKEARTKREIFFVEGKNPLIPSCPSTKVILKRPLISRVDPIDKVKVQIKELEIKSNRSMLDSSEQIKGRQMEAGSKGAGISIFIPRLNKVKRDASTSTTEDNYKLCSFLL